MSSKRIKAQNLPSYRGALRNVPIFYSIEHLHTHHVVVMGHYGCGGVAAAIASPPSEPMSDADKGIQKWVRPIRETLASSDRWEFLLYSKGIALMITSIERRLSNSGKVMQATRPSENLSSMIVSLLLENETRVAHVINSQLPSVHSWRKMLRRMFSMSQTVISWNV